MTDRYIAAGVLLALGANHALAHGMIDELDRPWYAWWFSYDVIIPILLFLIVYLRGSHKRRLAGKPLPSWRMVVYFSGLLSFFIALQSPIGPLSEHFLFMHQIEHMLLRSVGPILIILSMPASALLQGLPEWPRHHLVAPLIRSRVMKTLFRFFAHPITAPLLFVVVQIVWQIPEIHDFAVTDRTWHNAMHYSMVFTGFFFWWLICDPRGRSAHLSYGMRLILLWLMTVPNTLLGAIITLYKTELYQIYDVLEERWGISRLLDQQLGGIIIWGPDGMMGFIGTGIVFLLWLREEKKKSAPHVMR